MVPSVTGPSYGGRRGRSSTLRVLRDRALRGTTSITASPDRDVSRRPAMSIRDHIQRRWRRSEAIAVAAYPLRRYLPTARIRDAVMTRRGLKWGVPALLLAIPYLAAIAPIRAVHPESAVS